MPFRLFILTCLMSVSGIVDAEDKGCPQKPEKFKQYGDHCYHLTAQPRAHSTCLEDCISYGGFLAEPQNTEQTAEIVQALNGSLKYGVSAAYVGGEKRWKNRQKEIWVWTRTGNEIPKGVWAVNEPGNNDKIPKNLRNLNNCTQATNAGKLNDSTCGPGAAIRCMCQSDLKVKCTDTEQCAAVGFTCNDDLCTCKTRTTHYLSDDRKECLAKKGLNKQCTTKRECIAPLKCLKNKCACKDSENYNEVKKECVKNEQAAITIKNPSATSTNKAMTTQGKQTTKKPTTTQQTNAELVDKINTYLGSDEDSSNDFVAALKDLNVDLSDADDDIKKLYEDELRNRKKSTGKVNITDIKSVRKVVDINKDIDSVTKTQLEDVLADQSGLVHQNKLEAYKKELKVKKQNADGFLTSKDIRDVITTVNSQTENAASLIIHSSPITTMLIAVLAAVLTGLIVLF